MSLWKSLFGKTNSSSKKAKKRRPQRRRLQLESLEDRRVFSAAPLDGAIYELAAKVETDAPAFVAPAETTTVSQSTRSESDGPSPVLMVISNQDFWYQDYIDTRASLEAQGLEVVVAATTTEVAKPHANSGQGANGGFVTPDLALTDVEVEDYSGIVFSGGWGMAQYQYGFEGVYHNSAYQGDRTVKQVVNTLVQQFLSEDKHVAAVCYGVSVLAYARVDGESPLLGRNVTGWDGAAPSSSSGQQSSRMQIESSGAFMARSGAVGDPTTSTDDVIVDGRIITAENFDSARMFGQVVGREILAAHFQPNSDTEEDRPLPVLMVIANQDFYHREYYETRESLEAAGLEVVVAAATTETATPHAVSVVEGREPNVTPDLALADVHAEDYSTVVFIGGYGAASYQYANETVYDNPIYNGSDRIKTIVNNLINDFVDQDKHLAAICNGVSILAWARVDGASPLEGRHVAAWSENLPSVRGIPQSTRTQIEQNGGEQFASSSIGDPTTATDDVWIDGNIITAENYDSAYAFGRRIADILFNRDA